MFANLEELLHKPVICADGDLRKLVRIESDLVYYEVPISETRWMALGGTWRWQVEELFLLGRIKE